MARQRKTRDVYEIQGNYGSGWEVVTEEETLKDAKVQLRCYEENESAFPHKIRKRRVKI